MRILLAGIAVAALVGIVGCADDTIETGTETGTTISSETSAVDIHAVFDPCTDIDSSFIADEQLNALPPKATEYTVGRTHWQGCNFVSKSGYGLIVQTTNGTLDQVRAKGFVNYVDLTINNRRALQYDGPVDAPAGGCAINVEMKGGSLEIGIDDPNTENTRRLQPCDLATYLAEKIVPMLPTSS